MSLQATPRMSSTLGPRDGLLVGDDRERFEGRLGVPGLVAGLEEFLQVPVELRPREELEPAGDLLDGERPAAGGVFLVEFAGRRRGRRPTVTSSPAASARRSSLVGSSMANRMASMIVFRAGSDMVVVWLLQASENRRISSSVNRWGRPSASTSAPVIVASASTVSAGGAVGPQQAVAEDDPRAADRLDPRLDDQFVVVPGGAAVRGRRPWRWR